MINIITLGLIMAATSPTPVHKGCHDTKTATPVSRDVLMKVLKDSYNKVFNEEPSKERLLMGWAHVAFENGGGATIFNNNFGNVGPYTGEMCYKNKTGKHAYRSYEAPIDGAVRYWEVVSRCEPAWTAFDAGHVRQAMAALKRCKYFELDLNTYAHRVSVIYDHIAKKVAKEEEHAQEGRQRDLEDRELADRHEQVSVGRCDRFVSR